jgi:hypothetical protein
MLGSTPTAVTTTQIIHHKKSKDQELKGKEFCKEYIDHFLRRTQHLLPGFVPVFDLQ